MLGENFYGNSSINERMEPKQQLAARHTGRQSTGSSSGGGGAYY